VDLTELKNYRKWIGRSAFELYMHVLRAGVTARGPSGLLDRREVMPTGRTPTAAYVSIDVMEILPTNLWPFYDG